MELLKDLCQFNAVSGNEKQLNKYIIDLFGKFCEVYEDKMGNVIATLDNKADFTILLEAHTDEIGLMVKNITENGFIEFVSVGGIDTAIIPGKEVTVHGKKDLYGVIGAKPPHLMNEQEEKEKITFDKMFIDCGYNKETMDKFVSVGDFITFKGDFVTLANNCFSSKAIDNRMGIYVLYKVLHELSQEKINANIIFLCAGQEELGCLGAKTGVKSINPDYAIVVDVTHGNSTYIDKFDGFELGKGPAVGVGPNFSNKYNRKFVDYCKKYDCQIEVCSGHSGTDAWPIQISNNGIPCSLISVPIRHMHSQTELCDFEDILTTVKVISEFIKEEGYVC